MSVSYVYPTDEGKVLSSIIRSKMIDYFASGKPISGCPSIVQCFAENEFSEISSRVENVKANMAILEGIKEYCDNYSSIELSATGAAMGAQECINIGYDDGAMVGSLELNSNILFMVYSIPRIFFTDATLMEGHEKANDKFFKTLCLWLGLPFTDIKSYMFTKSTYIKGTGKILFTGHSELDMIMLNVNTACAILVDENYEYFMQNGESIPDIFERYWDIMASGVVELLNYNEIYSIDLGFAVTAGAAPIGLYNGMSEGKCTFGKDMNIKLDVELPDIPVLSSILGKLNFILNKIIPDIDWPTITIRDKFGVDKRLTLRLDIGKITGKIEEIASLVVNKITDAYNKMIDGLVELLTRLGYSIDKIIEKVNEVFDKILVVVNKIVNAITEKLQEFIDFIIGKLCEPLIKQFRNLIWNMLQAIPSIGISIFTPVFQFNVLSKFIDNIKILISKISSISNIFTKLTDGISNFFDKLFGIIEEIVDFISGRLNKFINNFKCDEFKSAAENVGNVNAPTLINSMPSEDSLNVTVATTEPIVNAASPTASSLSSEDISSNFDAVPNKPQFVNPISGESSDLIIPPLPTDPIEDPNEFGIKSVLTSILQTPTIPTPPLAQPTISY